MTINRLLSGSIFAMALIAICLGGMVAFEQWTSMRAIATSAAQLQALKALGNIPATVNAERGLMSLRMTTVAPGDMSQQESMAESRKPTDAAFADAKAKVALLAGRIPDADTLIAGVDKAQSTWLAVRATTDKLQSQTPIDQRGDASSSVIEESGRLNAAINTLLRDQLRQLSDVSGGAYRFADIANTAWTLRDVAGMQAGMLQNAVATNKPASVEFRAKITQLEGRVQQVWAALAPLPDLPSTPERLKKALQVVKANYFGVLAADKARIFAGLETGSYPYDALTFRQKFMDAWKEVIGLRDDAYAEAAAQMDREQSDASARFYIAAAGSLLALILSITIGLLVRSRVTKPLAAMTDSMVRISGGDLEHSIPGLARKDEIGGMAKALQVFKDGLRRNLDLELDGSRERASVEARRKALLADLASTFESSVGGIVGSVADSARELEGAARIMSQTAVETSDRSTSVAVAAEEASTNVGAVASSAEELGSSVNEISRQVQQSSRMSQAAVSEAVETAGIVKELSLAASKISDVVGLISSIAGQTNLLALNATIEAARAGEAGRGFAIVAAEVKELANQTAKATHDISEQISAIQNSTERAVGAIDGIGSTIQAMNGVAAAISASVEQQGAATSEIVRTIAQASAGTEDVTSNIGAVARAANESGVVATQVLTASATLSRQAEDLRREVDGFLRTVRSA